MKKTNKLTKILESLAQLSKDELLQVRFVVGRQLIKLKKFRKLKSESLFLTQTEMRKFTKQLIKANTPESKL